MEFVFWLLLFALVGLAIGPTIYYRTASNRAAVRHRRPNTERHTLRVDAEGSTVREAVLDVVARSGMRITSGRKGGPVQALTRFNLVTYGEIVTVWVHGDGASTVVEVESTPMQLLVLFDLGRNLENVAAVMTGVQQAAAGGSIAPSAAP